LRTTVVVDAEQLADWASGQYARRFEGLLRAAHRGGLAVVGTERVRDAISSQRAVLLIVAGDASARRQELVAAAQRLGRSCIVHADNVELGRLFDRETVAIAAITDSDIAEELQHAFACAALLAEAS
jgi:ribosomal protein L7Ae-like RNA K-turn-binding protein